jgi:hypothetical protein
VLWGECHPSGWLLFLIIISKKLAMNDNWHLIQSKLSLITNDSLLHLRQIVDQEYICIMDEANSEITDLIDLLLEIKST